ncbi:centromere-associated protein E [Centropristis striata]|uniref:centromere-associated protein E n=1 Tax=Centropristis striata TaxID=184440 RepID=UPI0027DF9B22|nr:centromere-associated protein E [Centropristis striata]
MTEESAVKVCVRVRPLIAREESAASEDAEPVQFFWKADKKSVYQINDGNSTKSFSFDRVFTEVETTNHLYQDIAKPLVVSSVEGYNGTIFAYGQTSSGKTFTMMGSDHIHGVIPLAVEDVFQTIKNCPKKEFLLRVSYMEIYNETVSDLLVDSWKRKPLEVRETINKNIYVADLTEELVTTSAQALAWIRKGEKNRHYGKTKMNERSSRSHTIFRMILESRERSDPASGENADGAIIVSHLNLVDLAGSERASQTGAEGTRFKEGCNINRSLFTLGQVIKKLTDESQKGFTNYRDSKLTRILQNSLGGNAKTVIICTITPVALDETLSTLQFASTAKKMKNDPHVTEVSDDGALLKRYRNEIVDLKRRLHEVSSVTQTTATEKKQLSQLLQEKDQLQREQEDRIRNLTKLLVTSSNLVPVQKMPKRRVTWGGKMLRFARLSECDGGSSDLSFAESFNRKRKGSNLTQLCEDDDDFDSHWEIPDEPSDEMDMSSVTDRRFGDSPKDFVSPDSMRELSGKMSNLEAQLEMESQQKEEAMAKVETLDGRVAELELQLKTEAQQKEEAWEKMKTAELRVVELDLQLQIEAQQKQETIENMKMLDLRVVDLESQLEQQSHTQSDSEQMRREFAETIQLCETLASEKDIVLSERDYLRQELGMFIEQTERLEKEKAAMSQELKEKRELEEFKSLEEDIWNEDKNELQNEISNLKAAVESSQLQCLELQNKLETLSEELKKKTEFAEQLQSMSGKDLVQEVAQLRRSLDDAEGLSRDTKKEWAVLRSQNIAVEEVNATLTANHEKMEAEVNSLRFHLDTEKSRYRKMQNDLQKELNVVFDENTKLTTLLDGKVPKNLIDNIEIERKVAQLNKELAASHEAEGALRAQLEELASLQTLPDKLNQLTEELQCVQAEKDALTSKQNADAEEMEKLLSMVTSVTEERDLLRSEAQENVEMMIENQGELRTALEKNREQKEQIKQLLTAQTSQNEINAQMEELQTLVQRLTEELESIRAERDSLLSERTADTQPHSEEMEKLLFRVTSLSEERDQLQEILEGLRQEKKQLREELEDRMEMMQMEVFTARVKENLGWFHLLPSSQMRTLTEKLNSIEAERDTLLSEKETGCETSTEEMEKLLCRVTSLSEERDQLQETLEGLRQEKKQLREELEDRMETMQMEMRTLTEKLECIEAERDTLLSDKETGCQTSTEEMEKLLCRVTSLSEERDQLQATLEGLRQLREELEDRMETMQTEMRTLTDKLESITAERDTLLSEKETSCQTSTEEMEKLLCRVTSLSEERDQLQETLEGLRQEKKQLREELEDRMEMMQCEFQQQLSSAHHSLKDEQEAQQVLQLEEHLEKTKEEVSQLKSDLQENIELMIENQEELRVSQENVRVLQDEINVLRGQQAELQGGQSTASDTEIALQLQNQVQRLTEELESMRAKSDSLLSERTTDTQPHSEEMEKLLFRVTSLSEERDQLQEILEGLRQEKKQLREELEDRMEMMQMEMRTLTEKLNSIEAERDTLLSEKETSCQTSTEEMEKLLCRVTSLSEERDQLQEILEGLRQEKKQLREELEDRMETMQTEMRTLTEKLESITAERDTLLSEKETSSQASTEEMEKLLCRVTSVSEERDQLQEILEGLRQEKKQLREELEDRMEASTTQEALKSVQKELCEQKQINSNLEKLCQDKECSLNQQMRTLTEKLNSIEAERDTLLSEKETSCQTSTEEMEKLLCRVTSLSEERDQLQEILEGLRQEKKQLREELEDRMETMQTEMRTLTEKLESITAERDTLLSEKETSSQSSTEEMEKLLCRVTSLSEERDQLQEILEGLKQEKKQLREELEDRMETMQTEMRTLTDKMESITAERDTLLSEKETSCQTSTEEMEKLLCKVSSLSEERDQLQETLEGLRQEKKQLREELEDRIKMVSALQEKLSEQEKLNLQQQMLSEATTTISADQPKSLDQSTSGLKETMSSRLQDSTGKLQDSFKKFQHFIDTCSKFNSTTLDKVHCGVKDSDLTFLPKSTMSSYIAVSHLGLQTAQSLGNITEHIQVQAQGYRRLFEDLVKKDLAVFEERRLQDVLLCRAQAPCYSVKDEDFHTLWDHRLTELLDKRQIYLQKMDSILGKLWANMALYPSELSADIRDRERFKEQMEAVLNNEPTNFSGLDSMLSSELDHRSAVLRRRKTTLQDIIKEQNGPIKELKQLKAQVDSQLKEERSKNSTLLQTMEGAPLKTELSLLKDNQQLVLQLQQTEEKVKALRVQNEQLEEAQIKASSRVSNHKQATQLLQTELQDSRAQVEEKEDVIQTLRSKLRESEASPSAVELEKLRTKLFKMEVEFSSASDKHEQEIQRMTTLLSEKEESLRKLGETLRRSQQQGEDSFLQGEDLHARLTNPRGLAIKTSILMEKNKLEEEVKKLQLKISDLESLVSSQQSEINKWKSRAIKLKVKSKPEVEKPSSPCTPTKRPHPMASDSSTFLTSPKKILVTPRKVLGSPMTLRDSPRKVLGSPMKLPDSPRKVLGSPKKLNSPKSRFFDVDESSELLSRTYPKQFFDNSSLGTIPEISNVPDTTDEEDAAVGADRKDLWPKSPTQEEMCKHQ